MSLQATEFLRRFFLHMLPKGFVRIRHFGFLSNRYRATLLRMAQSLLTITPASDNNGVPKEEASTWHCPHCGTPMMLVQKLTALELRHAFFDSS